MQHKTVATIVNQILKGNTSVYSQLPPDERALLDVILGELKNNGKSVTLSSLWEQDFEIRPVTIDKFLEDDYYLGKIGKDIFPKWREELRVICDPNKEVCEWVIRGCVGAGKTTVAVIALLHRIQVLCCMKNPQQFYGLMEGSPIVFGLFNIYKYLAQDTSYKYFTNWVKLSPFFQDSMRSAYAQERSIPGWLQRLNRMYGIDNDEMANSYMRFPKGITIALGSSAIHALGQNLYGGLCDEADMSKNRALKSDEKTKVEELYGQAKSRLDSRFLQLGGLNPGLLVLVSQVQEADSFLSKHVEKVSSDIRTHVSSFSLWEIKEHLFPPTEPRFQVVVGTRSYRSFLVEPGKAIPKGAQVIDVPESLRPRFEYSIDDAIRDQAGIPTYGANLFLPRRDKLFECYQKSAYRDHPFTTEQIELSIEVEDQSSIADYFVKEACMNQYDKATGRWQPKWFPGEERAIHIDLSKNGDCTGMAMGCIGNIKRVQRYDGDGRPYWEQDYETFIDFALRIKAAKGSEIDFSKIRQFIFYLQSVGFIIRYLSLDGYNSVDTIQIMKKAGFDAKELSVDKKATQYNYLKSTIYELRLDMYEYEPFTDEITKLQDKTMDNGKPPIDHPPKGKKDVSDAVCGVTSRLAEIKDELRPSMTSSMIEQRAKVHSTDVNKHLQQLQDQSWIGSVKGVNPLSQLFKR